MGLVLKGVVLGFEVEGDVSLKPLVEKFGFSKPQKKDNGSVVCSRSVVCADETTLELTLTRKDAKFLYSAKCSEAMGGIDVDEITAQMLDDLESVGL